MPERVPEETAQDSFNPIKIIRDFWRISIINSKKNKASEISGRIHEEIRSRTFERISQKIVCSNCRQRY